MPVDEVAVPEPELFSLVFKLQRCVQTVTDPSGLGEIAQNPQSSIDWGESEKRMAVHMDRKASRALDLDVFLQDKPDEYSVLVDQCASQLEMRNYDPGKFRTFATSIPRIPMVS